MINQNDKTIAAIATASGIGGIAIIRVSGKKAFDITFSIVKVKEQNLEPRVFYLGTAETGKIKDEVMVVYFKGPKSYTGEDVVEIHCHGSSFIKEEILRSLIEKGCSHALSGEFTKRAFLNGRITLTEAESVIDLINSESEAQVNAAFISLKGELSKKITDIQDSIISMTAAAAAAIDYPEEGIEEETKADINKFLESTLNNLETLLASYDEGRIVKEGIRVVIAGEPNAGKSMLLNSLLGYDRAIVTDIEGTTRDTVEEYFFYKGLKFVLTDTAGLRETGDLIEQLGIKRSLDAIKNADIILKVMEYGKDENINKTEKEDKIFAGKRVIYVINKVDTANEEVKKQNLSNATDKNKIYISALKKTNIDKLKDIMLELAGGEKLFAGGAMLNNARHYNAVKEAYNALLNAKENLFVVTLDCIVSDLDESFRVLGRVTGKTASDEIVNEIFSRFCVGK